MSVYDRHMPSGFPGVATRASDSVIETGHLAEQLPYGAPVTLNAAGKYVKSVAAAAIAGFLVRPYPAAPALSGTGADAAITQSILRQGYTVIELPAGETPVQGTQLRLVEVAAGDLAVGDLSTVTGVVIPGAHVMGAPDGWNRVEISVFPRGA